MNRQKVFHCIFFVLGLLCSIVVLIFAVSAVRFSEWGRVLLYTVILLFGVEITAIFGAKLFERSNSDAEK